MQSAMPTRSFAELAGVAVDIKIVDIGANPIDGEPPYFCFLNRNQGRVVGFEPNPSALAKLQTLKGPRDTYLPHAVGDGERHTLHICAAPGMTSLLEPNTEVLNLMHGFPMWGKVLATEEVQTVRLADITEAAGTDYLKMDIQGAELMVLRNSGSVLDDVGVIHIEVEFMQLYKNQPLFADVAQYLRERGFMFHRFFPIVSRMIVPMSLGGDPYAGMSQQVWADAIFIRDFTKLESVTDKTLIYAAAILHDCYQSFDVAMHMLTALDKRNGTSIAVTYLMNLRSSATNATSEPQSPRSIVPQWRPQLSAAAG